MTYYYVPFGHAARRRNMSCQGENVSAEACEVLIPVNVKAETNDFVITALLPGVKADDVAVQVVDETVTISGELKNENQEQTAYLLREQPVGRFYRVLRLPVP